MSGRNWQAFDAELRARALEIGVELLGKPAFRAGQEWRWGHKGSLCVVIAGSKAGMWFDHEAGDGGGLGDLVAREKRFSRTDARDWTADRIGMGTRHGSGRSFKISAANVETKATKLDLRSGADEGPENQRSGGSVDPAALRADDAAIRAARIWAAAGPASADHAHLVYKQAAALFVRCNARGHLVVPLHDTDGVLHSLETIGPDGARRFLAGGGKRGHFCVIGMRRFTGLPAGDAEYTAQDPGDCGGAKRLAGPVGGNLGAEGQWHTDAGAGILGQCVCGGLRGCNLVHICKYHRRAGQSDRPPRRGVGASAGTGCAPEAAVLVVRLWGLHLTEANVLIGGLVRLWLERV